MYINFGESLYVYSTMSLTTGTSAAAGCPLFCDKRKGLEYLSRTTLRQRANISQDVMAHDKEPKERQYRSSFLFASKISFHCLMFGTKPQKYFLVFHIIQGKVDFEYERNKKR